MSRILFIHHSGIIGGAGVSLTNVIKTASRSNDVTVYISDDPDDMLKLLNPLSNEYGITVKSYGRRIGAVTYYSGGDSILSPRFLYRLSLLPKQWRTWNKYIRECSPDTVIVNSKILCWMSMLSEVKKRNSICFVRETMNGKSSFFLNKIISNGSIEFSCRLISKFLPYVFIFIF